MHKNQSYATLSTKSDHLSDETTVVLETLLGTSSLLLFLFLRSDLGGLVADLTGVGEGAVLFTLRVVRDGWIMGGRVPLWLLRSGTPVTTSIPGEEW